MFAVLRSIAPRFSATQSNRKGSRRQESGRCLYQRHVSALFTQEISFRKVAAFPLNSCSPCASPLQAYVLISVGKQTFSSSWHMGKLLSYLQVRPMAEDEMFKVMRSGKRQKKQWKRMVTKPTFVGAGFTRKPPKYERFIRPTGKKSY